MSLTDADLAYLRTELGDELDEDDAEERAARLGGNIPAVVAELTRARITALLAEPASYSLPGVYTQSTEANIKLLSEKANRLEAAALVYGQPVVEPGAVGVVSRVKLVPRRGR